MVTSTGAVAYRLARFQSVHYIHNIVIYTMVIGFVKEVDAFGDIEPRQRPNQSFKLVHGQFQLVQAAGRRQAYT
jgi:hypothetical protein